MQLQRKQDGLPETARTGKVKLLCLKEIERTQGHFQGTGELWRHRNIVRTQGHLQGTGELWGHRNIVRTQGTL